MSTLATGTRILSNFARIAFLSCSRRVPFLSWISSSLGRLMAMVFDAGVRVAGVVQDVVGVQIGIRARLLALVGLRRQAGPVCNPGSSSAYRASRRLHSLSFTST